MSKKVAIIQSNYIPWKGYFDIINSVDEFIIYDDVQYTKRDWRNRNIIKTPKGLQWITIPVRHEYLNQKIKDIKVADKNWNKKHWKTLQTYYAKSKYFSEYKDIFEELYLNISTCFLSEINYNFIITINKIIGIEKKISWSSDYILKEGRVERLIDLCKQANTTEYVSGAAAKQYIDEQVFSSENIKLSWMDYSGYPEYYQSYPPFEHGVSIIDLIFNEGINSKKFMKSFGVL